MKSITRGVLKVIEGYLPQLLPPVHSYQVAEPLMSQFVSDNVRNSKAHVDARLLIGHQGGFTVSDQTPVLHGARSKVRNGNHVLLGKRVGDTVVVLKVGKNLA